MCRYQVSDQDAKIDTTKLFGALAAYFDLLTYRTGLQGAAKALRERETASIIRN